MNLRENIRLALSSLVANKMRALLTMLGIIIGIGAVIGIVTVGDSLTYAFTSTMADTGVGNIMVALQQKDSQVGMTQGVYSVATPSESDLITTDMLDMLKETYPDEIKAYSVTESVGSGQARDGRLYANLSISGVTEGYADANDLDLLTGRFINESDTDRARNVAVVSDRVAENYNTTPDRLLGQKIKVSLQGSTQTFTVVGVYKYEASSMMAMMGGVGSSDEDTVTSAYIPVTTAKKITGGSEGYDNATVVVYEGVDSGVFSSTVRSFMNVFYKNNTQYQCMVVSMESMISLMGDMMGTISIAIAVIAGISLLVGGIGVMNIMLVSITERTREIGTRKALGAPNSAIRVQFIVEAVIICMIGGVFGIICGVGMGILGASLLGYPAVPSVTAIILAVTFSAVIGIFFGYYPANKAAKLDPIEALRYE